MAVMTRSALYRRIDSMRRKYGIQGVFDPYAFAGAQAIPLALHRFTNERLRGILVRTGAYHGVILDTRLTPAEQRFTLTHEIVHFELHCGEQGHYFYLLTTSAGADVDVVKELCGKP